MTKLVDLTKKTFGYLRVLRRARNRHGRVRWHCRCKCGKHTAVASSNLISRGVVSCGCKQHEYTRKDYFFDSLKRPLPGGDKCLEWPYAKMSGYGYFTTNKRNFSCHREAWKYFNGRIPKGKCVLHHCDNPPCYRRNHLFLGNNKINALDRHRKGRGKMMFSKTYHPLRRLSDNDVAKIRKSYERGELQREIADRFAVCRSYVSMIVNGHKRSNVNYLGRH